MNEVAGMTEDDAKAALRVMNEYRHEALALVELDALISAGGFAMVTVGKDGDFLIRPCVYVNVPVSILDPIRAVLAAKVDGLANSIISAGFEVPKATL